MWNTTPVLPGRVEVQPVRDHDVEEVLDGQRLEPVVLQVVGGDQVLHVRRTASEQPLVRRRRSRR